MTGLRSISTTLFAPIFFATTAAATPIKYTGDPNIREIPYTVKNVQGWHSNHVVSANSNYTLVNDPVLTNKDGDSLVIQCYDESKVDLAKSPDDDMPTNFRELYNTVRTNHGDSRKLNVGPFSGFIVFVPIDTDDHRTTVSCVLAQKKIFLNVEGRFMHDLTQQEKANLLQVIRSITVELPKSAPGTKPRLHHH